MTNYQRGISDDLKRLGISGIDPRHIEGYMRLEHSTLSNLSPAQFKAEVSLCSECVLQGGVERAEENAMSFGL